jgi:hypothetical protein
MGWKVCGQLVILLYVMQLYSRVVSVYVLLNCSKPETLDRIGQPLDAACTAVSLIIPARKGRFHKQCLEIAGILLQDEDDLVQKGYGWLLKTASEYDQELIYDFVMKNKSDMPRTALRYAIEKMPEERRKKAMER